MHVDNWIQWMPKIGSLYAPENLQKVTSQGLEYGAKAHFNFAALKTTFGGNYAYTLARQTEVYNQTAELNGKQLVYVPYQTATAFSDLHYKNWQLSLNWQYTGRRFTTPENDRALPAYQLLSIYAGKTFRWQKFQFQVLGRVNNVTNTVYQNLEFYAMPGRHYNLSFRFQLK